MISVVRLVEQPIWNAVGHLVSAVMGASIYVEPTRSGETGAAVFD